MREISVCTKTVFVGKKTVEILKHLMRGYTIYLDIGGASKHVIGPQATSDSRIVVSAATATIDPDWGIVVITDDLRDIDQLTIYGVKTAPILTGKLSA